MEGWLAGYTDGLMNLGHVAIQLRCLRFYHSISHTVFLGRVSCFNSSGFTILDKRGKYPQLSLPGHIRTNIQAHPHK